MNLNLSADEVLNTTRSVRKRLDFDRPVERTVVEECLEIALQAPTGSNSQGWHWFVVEDAAKKKADGIKAQMMKGDYVIFKGPLKDNTGKEIIPAGKAFVQTDPVLEQMNYLVEGVIGKV